MNRKGDRIVGKKEKKRKEKANAKKKKDGKEKDGKKKDKANRDDKQRKADFDKGMRKGAAVVSNENLTNQEIKVSLNKLELQYQLKELAAEKENLQTWILSGKLDEYKRTKKIERKPTKAETEEEVSEADRKLHERIAAKVEAELEAKGRGE